MRNLPLAVALSLLMSAPLQAARSTAAGAQGRQQSVRPMAPVVMPAAQIAPAVPVAQLSEVKDAREETAAQVTEMAATADAQIEQLSEKGSSDASAADGGQRLEALISGRKVEVSGPAAVEASASADAPLLSRSTLKSAAAPAAIVAAAGIAYYKVGTMLGDGAAAANSQLMMDALDPILGMGMLAFGAGSGKSAAVPASMQAAKDPLKGYAAVAAAAADRHASISPARDLTRMLLTTVDYNRDGLLYVFTMPREGYDRETHYIRVAVASDGSMKVEDESLPRTGSAGVPFRSFGDHLSVSAAQALAKAPQAAQITLTTRNFPDTSSSPYKLWYKLAKPSGRAITFVNAQTGESYKPPVVGNLMREFLLGMVGLALVMTMMLGFFEAAKRAPQAQNPGIEMGVPPNVGGIEDLFR